jgi:hypothetical protein
MTWEEVELRSGQRISVTTDVREAIKRRPEMYLDAARYDRTRRVASEWGMTDCASDEDFAALELVRGARLGSALGPRHERRRKQIGGTVGRDKQRGLADYPG